MLREKIQEVVTDEPVALFMKGTPQLVMCGNSERALHALRQAGAPVTAVNVLPDPRIRQELSDLSGWPTIPQVFVRGELVGGADIVEELAASGELEQKLEEKLGPEYRNGRQERPHDDAQARLPADRPDRDRRSAAAPCPLEPARAA
jgi:monothiol glutaredoxin